MFFFSAIEKDYRITTAHLGLFAALLQCRAAQGSVNPIRAYSHQIMNLAKISGQVTYLKHIRDLSEYGYLRYEPSLKKNKPSLIYFLSG